LGVVLMGLVLIIYLIVGFFAGMALGIIGVLWYRIQSKIRIRDWGKVFYLGYFLGFLSLIGLGIFTWPPSGPPGDQDWDALSNALFIFGASPGTSLFIGAIALFTKSKLVKSKVA
jgi:hypothetical protein